MTLRLILIRHAKSAWDDPAAQDHARVLNARGRASATAIGGWLADKGYVPDVVLCSDAARTAETLALILPALPQKPEVTYLRQLYHASPEGMLMELGKVKAPVVAMVGHNPGIGGLAAGLVQKASRHPRFQDYPTAATTVIDFATEDWALVRPGTGHAVDFVVPRDLIGGDAD